MISANNISVYFGGQELFDDVSFMVNKGDRIGLVGKNGAGKSTLLRILSGEQKANEGSISTPNESTIGYLRQDLEFEEGRTVQEEAEQAFQEIKKLEQQITAVNLEMSERTDYESDGYMQLITDLNDLNERFGMLGGYTIQSEMSQVLIGLGFQLDDFERQTNEFSGGWRMRLELAKILLSKPDVLLLDEPTNHLDIESIVWLEGWLKNYSGAVVLVSHDRAFLDAVTNRTIDLILGKANDYKASYSKYVELRKDRQEKQIQSKKNQDKEIKQTKMLIEKFRAKKSKASFAQSLIKKLDKMDLIEVEQDETASMYFKFPPAPHSGKVTLKVSKVSKNYDGLQVLKDVSLMLERGDKIAFVGKNGEGKTTLAKMIVDAIKYDGEIEYGYQVKVGYYAQNQSELLDENKSIFEVVEDASDEHSRPRVRDMLGSFLFSGDTVQKKVKVLSGGERARVALCKLLLEPVNLLIMDEPTNHLDMVSKDILKRALRNYDGTLIIVSHDRDFLEDLTEKVYEFKDKNIKEYLGDINDFLKEKKVQDFTQFELENKQKSKVKKADDSANKQTFNERKQLDKDIRKLSNKVGQFERAVERLEKELKELDEELANPERYKELSSQKGFFESYQDKQNELNENMSSWEESLERLEELKHKRSKL
ncbi:MAG: ABC-F family ATP-binding cassette domain-containing protein [Flavobacteriales bacterium]|nr:ABC-F family ATP-binding cassette domain-containing protein [Flavobacteriales bacterium]|tara:strand:- start:2218 stop:4173 length:1956 start_codon:yes stop_codon:yes gene_type:complete